MDEKVTRTYAVYVLPGVDSNSEKVKTLIQQLRDMGEVCPTTQMDFFLSQFKNFTQNQGLGTPLRPTEMKPIREDTHKDEGVQSKQTAEELNQTEETDAPSAMSIMTDRGYVPSMMYRISLLHRFMWNELCGSQNVSPNSLPKEQKFSWTELILK